MTYVALLLTSVGHFSFRGFTGASLAARHEALFPIMCLRAARVHARDCRFFFWMIQGAVIAPSANCTAPGGRIKIVGQIFAEEFLVRKYADV